MAISVSLETEQLSTAPALSVVPTATPFKVVRKRRASKASYHGTWSKAARKKREKTWARKRRERARLAREATRKGSKGGKAIARPKPRRPAEERLEDATDRAIARNTEPRDGRTGRSAGEERLDAIAYLRAATEGYEGVPTSVCLSLLALRRLLGQIK